MNVYYVAIWIRSSGLVPGCSIYMHLCERCIEDRSLVRDERQAIVGCCADCGFEYRCRALAA